MDAVGEINGVGVRWSSDQIVTALVNVPSRPFKLSFSVSTQIHCATLVPWRRLKSCSDLEIRLTVTYHYIRTHWPQHHNHPTLTFLT